MRFFKLTIFLPVLVLLCCEVTAAEPTNMTCKKGETALSYILAIESRDVNEMALHWSEDIHYQDPTMAFFSTDAIDLKGSRAVQKFWQDAFWESNSQELSYAVEHCVNAGEQTILTMSLTLTLGGHAWDINTPTIKLDIIHIMSLKILDNKIAQQIDYVDYQEMTHQINELRKIFGSATHKKPN